MKISIRKRMQLNFVFYIQKYRQDKFNELAKGLYPDDEPYDLDDDKIQNVVNRMNPEDIKVFRIGYTNDIFEDVNDFIDYMECSFLVRPSKGKCGAEWKIKLLETTHHLIAQPVSDLRRPRESITNSLFL